MANQNMQQTPNDFLSFMKNFKGDPRQSVMQLIQNGSINNQTLQSAINQTNQLYRQFFGK
jgi:hypothetical protein